MNTTTEKNTTPNTTETEKKGKKNMNTTEKKNNPTTTPEEKKNTTPAPETTEKKNTEKKGKKNMKKEKKNTTPEKKNSLPDNIKQGKETLSNDVKELEKMMNTPTLAVKVKAMESTTGKDKKKVNDMLALQYYKKTPLFDIVKAGAVVPAVAIETTETGEKVSMKVVNTTEKPTLQGMKNAGIVDDELIARVDTLRRVAGFVKTGADVFLTGDTENKKDCPTEKVSAMIAEMGTLSKNKARALMTKVFRDLTGEGYKKEVFPKLYEEFEGYIIKRSREWGKRTIVGKSTACDMVMEFAWMYFNGQTAFKYIEE